MKLYRLGIIVSALFLSACTENYHFLANKPLDVKPSHAPMYNMTQSSKVLACVGRLIDRTNVPPIDVFIADIPDHTTPTLEVGFLTKNAVMMATTAVDRLATPKVAIVGHNGAKAGRRQVQILGAWTELNRTTSSNAVNGTVNLPFGLKVSPGGDQSYNHVALDLAMAENNRIVPLTATSVSIQVDTEDGNSTITYDNATGRTGAVIALGFTAQEGFHAAERMLVETSIALMMSRYYGIDMRDCLDRPNTKKDRKLIDQNIFPDTPAKPAAAAAPVAAAPVAGSLEEKTNSEGPSFISDNRTAHFNGDVTALPVQDGVIVQPRQGQPKRFMMEQPEEYATRQKSDFSGSYTERPQENSFEDRSLTSAEVTSIKVQAAHGIPEAQYKLGIIYNNGNRLPQDYKEAYFWLLLAANAGDRHLSLQDVHTLGAGLLSPEERQAVEQRASLWKPERP